MKKVIINADDFGINKVVTEEIERLIEKGAISSTTVMANGSCLEQARNFANLHPKVSYGVHLCLSEFGSITKSKSLQRAGLIDENGVFLHKAIFHSRNLKEKYVIEAIRNELNAQIEVLKSLGFNISHADSHHHVHTIYPLREVFAEVLQNSGIKRLRLGANFQTLRDKAHIMKWQKRTLLNRYYRKFFITTDKFCSFSDFSNGVCPIHDGETFELMCHPGHPGSKYQDEVRRMEQTVLPSGIKLISYNELH